MSLQLKGERLNWTLLKGSQACNDTSG